MAPVEGSRLSVASAGAPLTSAGRGGPSFIEHTA